MPERTARANAAKSKVRARVEHVFARPKEQRGLFIRTIGIKRAEARITLTNLACNMHRLIFHARRVAMGWLCPERRKAARNRHYAEPESSRSRQIPHPPSKSTQIMELMEVPTCFGGLFLKQLRGATRDEGAGTLARR